MFSIASSSRLLCRQSDRKILASFAEERLRHQRRGDVSSTAVSESAEIAWIRLQLWTLGGNSSPGGFPFHRNVHRSDSLFGRSITSRGGHNKDNKDGAGTRPPSSMTLQNVGDADSDNNDSNNDDEHNSDDGNENNRKSIPI